MPTKRKKKITKKKRQVLIVINKESFKETLISSLKSLFEEKGYKVSCTNSGKTGLTKMKKGGWDLVILGILLPKISGLDILEKLTKDEKKKSGPIIVLSSVAQEEVMKRALRSGASAYMTKSDIAPDDIFKKIQWFLDSKN